MKITLLLLFFLLPLQLFSVDQREKLKTIYELQDTRVQKDKRILTLLRDGNAAVRERAAAACGNLQDTTYVEELLKLLSDKNENVKNASSLALGQTVSQMSDAGRKKIEKQFFGKKLFSTPRMFEEFGKFCTQEGLKQFAEFVSNEKNEENKEAILLGIARAAHRNITHSKSTLLALRWYRHNERKICGNAMFALFRIGNVQEIKDSLEKILMFDKDSDAFLRVNGVSLLAKIGEPQRTLPVLATLSESDKDWRVRVGATRAIGKFDLVLYQGMLFSLLPLISDSNEHVSLAALEALKTFSNGDSLREEMSKELWNALVLVAENKESKFSLRQQGEAIVVLAKLFGTRASEHTPIRAKTAKNLTAKIIEAQAFIAGEESFQTLLDYISSDEPLFARTAIEGVQSSTKHSKAAKERISRAYEKLLETFSSSNDFSVLTTIATALGDSLFVNETSIEPLIIVFERQQHPDGIEVQQEILSTLGKIKSKKAIPFLEKKLKHTDRTVAQKAADALKAITQKDYSKKITSATKPAHTDLDWEFLFSLPEKPTVEIVTSKGSITLELYRDDAPFTVMNFLKLAKKGFYNNTFFHRVVSSFVIQGGDPRGDGWGGPGYAIRSEFSTQKYDVEGVVGMASAGKDTEGSQFFITHLPTPHLDGRYTIFGKVTKGMDVVNNIFVGDQVVEVKIP
ncbi:MAG: peptidylprolyl isomerase [Ignavibacteriales bacterium]|nr:peptidylprolyl isomerase [Ignavibacteriales bacterium]